ncbi:MAG: sugar phosphate isomerase/epimerase [Clostridia bacterium]|nr:sugar phosphate isomerase/epimerase [Clostridia bacterium]
MNYGLQLYSVRDLAKENYEEALKQVAAMGYKMVEPAGFFGLPASEVAAMLKHYGLTACSTHTGFQLMVDDFAGQVAYHKAIGCHDLILPSAPFKTAEDITATVDAINRWQPALEAEGIRLHYHNHSKEFWKNQDGLIAQEELADRTNILFELDTFWVFNAGLNPLDVMEQYRNRLHFIHLKDGIPQTLSDSESKPVGKSLGSGKAPIEAVRKKAIEKGVKIVVESEGLDPTGIEEVKRCIDHLKILDAKDRN